MAAGITRLRTKADRLRQTDGAALRQLVLDYAAGSTGVPGRAVSEIVAAIDRETAATWGWTFLMISPASNAAVVDWLLQHSRRPHVAVRLWSRLFMFVRSDTGEIVQTRDELAAACGCTPDHVSSAMTELEAIHAISRRRQRVAGMKGPGIARYFLNPLVGTHLAGMARANEQAQATALDCKPPLEDKPTRPYRRKLVAVPAD